MIGTKKAGFVSAMLVGILLYGCGGDAPATATPTSGSSSTSTTTSEGNVDGESSPGATDSLPSGPAAQVLSKAKDAMHAARSFQYEVMIITYPGEATPTADEMADARENASGFPSDRPLTEEEIEQVITAMGSTVVTTTGQGAYVAPDRARFEMTPNVPPDAGISIPDYRELAIAGQSFVYNASEQNYFAWDFSDGFGLDSTMRMLSGVTRDAALFDAYGIPGFGAVAQSALIKGEETLDGRAVVHIEFQTPALMTDRNVMGEVWIDKETSYVRQYTLTNIKESAGSGGLETSVVTITYSRFGEEVSPAIEKPDNIVALPTMQP